MKKTAKDFPMQFFLGQIDKIKEEFGLKTDRDFDRDLGLKNKLYRWREGLDKAASLEILCLIKSKYHKSLDWLIYEDTPLPGLSELPAEPYEVRPLAPLEADLLHRISSLVDTVLHKEQRTLPPEQKTRFITRIYNDCAEDRIQPDEIMVLRYLWILC